MFVLVQKIIQRVKFVFRKERNFDGQSKIKFEMIFFTKIINFLYISNYITKIISVFYNEL